MCRKHFHTESFLGLFWIFFKEEKIPQTQRQPIFTIENLQTQGKNKNTIERLPEEADQKTTQASQDPPQAQLEPHFCTSDKRGSVINHFSARHCSWRKGSHGATNGLSQAPRQKPRRDWGLRSSKKGNTVWLEMLSPHLCPQGSAELPSEQPGQGQTLPLKSSSLANGHTSPLHSCCPGLVPIKREHTLFKLPSWTPLVRTGKQLTADARSAITRQTRCHKTCVQKAGISLGSPRAERLFSQLLHLHTGLGEEEKLSPFNQAKLFSSPGLSARKAGSCGGPLA